MSPFFICYKMDYQTRLRICITHHVAINIVKDFCEMTIDYQHNYQFTYWTSLDTLVCTRHILPSTKQVLCIR